MPWSPGRQSPITLSVTIRGRHARHQQPAVVTLPPLDSSWRQALRGVCLQPSMYGYADGPPRRESDTLNPLHGVCASKVETRSSTLQARTLGARAFLAPLLNGLRNVQSIAARLGSTISLLARSPRAADHRVQRRLALASLDQMWRTWPALSDRGLDWTSPAMRQDPSSP